LRRLLESLLQKDRDDDDDDNNKQEDSVEPKNYEGYGLKDEGDNRRKEIISKL
jgi:hypothetical protein